MTGQKIANTGMRDTTGIVREPGILGIRTVVVTETETAGRNATGIMNAKEETATEIETEGKTMTLMLRMIVAVLATVVMIMITSKTGMVRRRGTLITRTNGGMISPVIQAGITVGVRMVGTAGDTMTTATTKAAAVSLMMMMMIQMHAREERMMVMTTVTKILGVVNGWMRTRKTMGTTARQRRSIGGQIGQLLSMIMSISS
ncbi:unnamed protein product [Cuscuta campestris]|uniref:Uncharacterized protein n=1 Tax=Cuscuta campestris TaxID=132261 RepID=A0A484MBI0_9ASTE|nr:unnamed protein product [Cuscuta campestris]